MKKISAKMFFTIMWKSLYQALGWFCGLFGYKRDGKFAKYVWRLFALSGTIVMVYLAGSLLYLGGEWVYYRFFWSHQCSFSGCYYSEYVSRNVCFHNTHDGKGYIYNIAMGKKTIENVYWITFSEYEDSLVCFSNGRKRGYFNKSTGNVVVQPKYDHAWVFSEGLAAVDDAGIIKFIDTTGKTVIDTNTPHFPDHSGYVFHNGYCVMPTNDGEHYGLIDTAGKMVVPMEYDMVYPDNDYEHWLIVKGQERGVLDKDLNVTLPLMSCKSIYIGDGTIDVVLFDHSIRKFDSTSGELINDFYITSFRMLEYENDEITYRNITNSQDEEEALTIYEDHYHPKATARLRAYVAGEGMEGLMTADGHIVTMPLYEDIDAIGPDLYLCTSTNYDKLIVNGKGEIVK